MQDFTPLKSLGPLAPVKPIAQSDIANYLSYYRLSQLLEIGEGVELYTGYLQATSAQDTQKNFDLWTQVWAPENPCGTVFIVHGYLDHLALYGHLIKRLLKQQWQVVLWDLPGHGLSSGARASIDDFADYAQCFHAVQKEIKRRNLAPGPWVAMGQSTGGSIVATDALTQEQSSLPDNQALPWQGIVLLAPLVRPHGWTKSRILHTLASPFVRSIPRNYRPNTTALDFAKFLRDSDPLQDDRLAVAWVTAMRRWIPTLLKRPPSQVPTLILQGEKDVTVDWEWNLKVLKRKFPQAQIKRHPEARHHLVNEAKDIRTFFFEQIDDFLASISQQSTDSSVADAVESHDKDHP